MESTFSQVSAWSYAAAAVVHALFGIYLGVAWKQGSRGGFLIVAVGVSAAWAALNWSFAVLGWGWLFQLANLVDVLRMGAWFGFLVALLRQPALPGEDVAVPQWPRLVTMAVISLAAFGVLCLSMGLPVYGTPLRTWAGTSLFTAVYGLVLLEFFYRAIPERSRWGGKPVVLALGCLFAFDIYLFADALMFSRLDPVTWSVRGLVHSLTIPLVAISASRNPEWTFRISVSRHVVFHSTALAASGLYLLLISGAGYYMRYFGGEWGEALQLVLLFGGALLLGVLAFSGAFRARLRVLLAKHFFAYRYDYRTEWLGVTQALSVAGDGSSLGESVVRALSDLVESPGGGVWLRGADGSYSQQARLNMPHSGVVEHEDSAFCSFLREREWVVNLAQARSGVSQGDSLGMLPAWSSEIADMWLIVPLISSGVLVGFVILLTPRTPVDVNWEVLDLLKTAGRQAASYFARMQATEALIEARKFDAFNRMSAFVVHDLKNLVAQMSLMLRNAERHKDNPEFQADMLDTVRHVEERMRGLMAQLMEKTPINQRKPVALKSLVEHIVQSKRMFHPRLSLAEGAPELFVLAHAERLERILGHIVQNALDATSEHGSVSVELSQERKQACITVLDTGSGMSAAFVRDQLFKPFQTTKASGMGIGAYESQQYVRELGGSLTVHSEVGSGSRFDIRLPIAETVRNTGNEAVAN